ncbi:uncharacterized protein B0T23DRAFT_43362 [Neurospora hispaniola]|uniref:Uncharacterized protein n=1 Tax=Neurospora hispaniola TaxID=588809 RepID=A0AAJ0HZ10_9PEZI|nr:hypothetical protein B0T23DRAFT_43362 [Neurospora hispaniola]
MKDGILSSGDTWTFESQYHQVQKALKDASRPLQVLEDISSESTLRQQTSTQPEMQAQTPTQPETELAIHMSKSEGPKETETSNEEPDGAPKEELQKQPGYSPGQVPTHVPEYAPAYYVLADAPLCESEDMLDDPPWFEPKYTLTDVPTDGPVDLPQNVPEESSQSIPEYCPPEEEVSTTVSWYEREVLSNLSKGEKNRKVNGPWAYIGGATESDFKKQKKRNPKSKEREAKEPEVKEHGVKDTETEKPAPSNPASPDPGATKLEEIKNSDWWDYHIDAANEPDFEKKKRDPKSKATETKDTDTKRSVPSKLASSSDPEATKLEEIKVSDWWDYHR